MDNNNIMDFDSNKITMTELFKLSVKTLKI